MPVQTHYLSISAISNLFLKMSYDDDRSLKTRPMKVIIIPSATWSHTYYSSATINEHSTTPHTAPTNRVYYSGASATRTRSGTSLFRITGLEIFNVKVMHLACHGKGE